MASSEAEPGKDTRDGEGVKSTQNTQYDQIGTRYNGMHELPAVEPERPSVVAALGDVRGKRCLDLACGTGRYTALLSSLGATSVHAFDISPVMIAGALASYPASTHPTLHFAVADCSKPSTLPLAPSAFDIVFAGWFLNYAGTEAELTNMFRVIAQQLAHTSDARFVGLTTNAHDKCMREPKTGFYGLDVKVLEERYVAPDTGEEVGIRARVVAHTEPVVQFDVFQFRAEVYERCARQAGLWLEWREAVVPRGEGARAREEGYWDGWLERPTFEVVVAGRV
ncbi:S-adenosyl-L-methionine-dependent methyltransferase [Massariosphaeria phaeospora]|uniref:S-adenosyl-L-methionine-dependent methyltransferase n=1 Tax=Massariosphaeria phaeospora TaxID=100035 RepID=A0A7C8MI49_9PLEO|nr:S-adenosyl-L-methionine-dependent methyltransferase [Massariosphaeria phaeospora]